MKLIISTQNVHISSQHLILQTMPERSILAPTSLSPELLRRKNACTTFNNIIDAGVAIIIYMLSLFASWRLDYSILLYTHHIVTLRRPDHWSVVKHLGEVGAAPVRLVP